jgi:hypothetical protein
MTGKPISRQFGKETQGWALISYWVKGITGEVRLRSVIHYDLYYPNQRTAKVEKWDGDRWNYVCGTLYASLPELGSGDREDAEETLIEVEAAQIALACRIIGCNA